MAIKTLRVFAEYTSTGFVPMPTAGGIDYGYTLANTFPSTTPSSFQTDDPDIDVTVTAMTDFYVWIRISGTAWNPSYTRNVRVYPDSPDINNVVMNMIIATGPAGTSAYSQIVQTSNRLYFNGATTDSVYNSKFAGKTYINELNFGTAPQLATVATSGAYADLTGKPALSTVATSGSYADLSNKPSGTAPISYNSGTNSFQISVASASTNGYLTSTDWNTFNAKYLLPSGGTTAQYLRGDGTLATFPTTLDSTRLIFTGRNSTGSTLTKGTVVYINGVSGNTALLAKAIASGDSTSAQTLGVVEFDIPNNSTGVVVLVGAVGNLDTSSYTEGVQLYLSGTVAGAFTSSKVLAPTHIVYVGIVTRAHPTLGTIEVKIQNGYELDEIHDVQISSPANKDILYHDTASSLWKHASIASVLGYTPYNATNPNNYIALTALSASAPLSYNNTTGAFSISQANTSTNGFLSSADWNTFNSKQNALTLGNVSEVSSNVLMFPDGGTGKTIGNLSIQVVQASASTNGYLSSTDWATFNSKQATITGGASTITTSNLTASRALISNASGKVDVSTVTSTELGYLSGVTSAIQTQLNAKQNTITNPVTGTGTSGQFAVWNSASVIGGSNLTQSSGSLFSSGGLIFNSYNSAFDTAGSITRHSVVGLVLKGVTASAFDFSLYSAAGTVLMSNPAGTNNINFNSGQVWFNGGNVGIGTSTTTSKLTISETNAQTNQIDFVGNNSTAKGHIGQFSNNLYISSNYFFGGGAQQADTSSLGQAAIVLSGGATTSSFIDFNTSNAGATSPGNKMRITAAGNVGIGTSSPTTAGGGYTGLDIRGTTGSSLLLGSTTTTCGYIYASASFLSFETSSTIPILFNPGGTERLRISSDGNIYNQFGGNRRWGMDYDTTGIYFYGLASNSNGRALRVVAAAQDALEGIFFQTGTSFANATTKMVLTPDGLLAVGATSSNGSRLYVQGSIYATGNITANSDIVLKKNLTLLDNPIDKLNQLNGYLYQWKNNDEYQYGVIAQEVEKILPHAVTTGNDGIKGVAYNQIIPLLIEAVKEQNKKIIALEAKLG